MGPKGCINRYGYGMAFPYIIDFLGVPGCIIWVIYPLVDAEGSATEDNFDYIFHLTEWKRNQRIELGTGLSYNTNTQDTNGRVGALSVVWEMENGENWCYIKPFHFSTTVKFPRIFCIRTWVDFTAAAAANE